MPKAAKTRTTSRAPRTVKRPTSPKNRKAAPRKSIQRVLEEFAVWHGELVAEIPRALRRKIAKRLVKEYINHGHLKANRRARA